MGRHDKGGPEWVAQTDDGIRVTDVWESREQFEKFAADQIGPITQEVGIPSPPHDDDLGGPQPPDRGL